jgi:eukaryotic-like serine/threonine-protein kinase
MYPLDRLLFSGLVALEREYISPSELIDAFRTWCLDPKSSLGHILARQGKLSNERLEALGRAIANLPGIDDAVSNSASEIAPTTNWRRDTASIVGGLETIASNPHGLARSSPRLPGSLPTQASMRYRPLRPHAAGGLGQVSVAEDLELHRQVALKEIQARHADDPSSRRRFVAEAEITGNLEHPGVVPVYGLGVYADGRPFYAMRFIHGQTLSDAINEFHRQDDGDFTSLKFRQLLGRLVGVCNAVAFAHSRGIVHRDLKPQNVMLGPFGETLVVDWGLAKSLHSPTDDDNAEHSDSATPPSDQRDEISATPTGHIIGTPAYMSPEQAQGCVRDIGPASDVYGLGAILYAMLTGKPPRYGKTAEVPGPLRESSVAPPRQLQPRVPRPLSAICLKAIAREPAERYASALDLAADIERWLADEATAAYVEPWTDTAVRWMRKHRLPVAVASALLLVSSIALGVGYALVRHERDIAQFERNKAVAAKQRAQQNAAATREVVEQFLIQVGDDRWSQIPGFEDVRIEMVTLAVNRYRQLLAQEPDDVALAADAAMAFRRCANLHRMVGKFDSAKDLYDEALSRFRATAAAKPQVAAYERRLCETLTDRALYVFRLEGPQAAEGPLREALSAGRQFQRNHPKNWDAVAVAARAQIDFADLLHDVGRENEAVELARIAIANLGQAAPRLNSPSARLLALHSQLAFGQMLSETGSLAEAKAVLDDAIARTTREALSSPNDTNLRFILAKGRFQRAVADAAEGAAAEDWRGALAEGIKALDMLVGEFPRTASFRRNLAEALTAQADFELRRSQHDAAAIGASQAIAHLERLDREEGSPAVFQPLLAAAYSVAGQAELARGDTATAKTKLAQAQQRLKRARELNPESLRLVDQSQRIESLLASLGS